MQISDEMVELAESYIAGGKCFNDPEVCSHMDCACRTQMRAALVAALPMIRAGVVEECAKHPEDMASSIRARAVYDRPNLNLEDVQKLIRNADAHEAVAVAIRAMGGDK